MAFRASISIRLTQVALGLSLAGFNCDRTDAVQSISSGSGLGAGVGCWASGGAPAGGRGWFRCSIPWSLSQYKAASSVYALKVPSLGAVTKASCSLRCRVGQSMVILIISVQVKPPASESVWLNSTRYSVKGREFCRIYLSFCEARSAFWGSLKIPSRYSKSFS